MCCSVGLLHAFFCIQRVDMLDAYEIPYSPPLEMSSHATDKLIIFLHTIFMRKWNVFMLHTSSYTMHSNIYWPPSNLNLTIHRSRWNDMKYILLLLQFYAVPTMIWLTAMEYLCQKWPQIGATCRKHSPGAFFMHDLSRVCN